MSDLEYSFLQAIACQPHDWLPRLIFADWLEERGDLRGELVRLSHQLTRLDCEERGRKEKQLQALSAAGVVWPSPSLPNSLAMKFVLIPPGQYYKGRVSHEIAPDPNKKQVSVTIDEGFHLGQYPVTQAEWEQMMSTTPWKGQWNVREGGNYPATCVSLEDISECCVKLTVRGHREGWLPQDWKVTLPTVAQWEYACRAGTESCFYFGDDESQLGQYAWFGDNAFGEGEAYAHLVGQKRPNPWGLSDMHGNVREWSGDIQLPSADLKVGVVCGGSWNAFGHSCWSTSRLAKSTDQRSSEVGFRLVVVQAR